MLQHIGDGVSKQHGRDEVPHPVDGPELSRIDLPAKHTGVHGPALVRRSGLGVSEEFKIRGGDHLHVRRVICGIDLQLATPDTGFFHDSGKLINGSSVAGCRHAGRGIDASNHYLAPGEFVDPFRHLVGRCPNGHHGALDCLIHLLHLGRQQATVVGHFEGIGLGQGAQAIGGGNLAAGMARHSGRGDLPVAEQVDESDLQNGTQRLAVRGKVEV
ncbi:hypothetical protein VTN96DRAFT_874 [Rasamsonia emersonii]